MEVQHTIMTKYTIREQAMIDISIKTGKNFDEVKKEQS
jgi:hypothetical protein